MPQKKTNEVDLLDEVDTDAAAQKQAEVDDLLDGMDGSSAKVWRPDLNSDGADDNQPTKLQGTIISSGEGPLGYEGAVIPWVEFETTVDRPDLGIVKGEKWVIRGYGNVLIQEIEKYDNLPGQTVVAGYFGRKQPQKGGKPYHHYGYKVFKPGTKELATRTRRADAPAGDTKSPF